MTHLSLTYYGNGADADSPNTGNYFTWGANGWTANQTFDYDSTALSTNGLLDYYVGNTRLKRTGYNATGKWIVGSPSGSTKIDQSTTFARVQDFYSAATGQT